MSPVQNLQKVLIGIFCCLFLLFLFRVLLCSYLDEVFYCFLNHHAFSLDFSCSKNTSFLDSVKKIFDCPGIISWKFIENHFSDTLKRFLHSVIKYVICLFDNISESLDFVQNLVSELFPMVGCPIKICHPWVKRGFYLVEMWIEQPLQVWGEGVDHSVVVGEGQVNHVLKLMKPRLPLYQELIDTWKRNVQLAKSVIFMQKVIENWIKIYRHNSLQGFDDWPCNHCFNLVNFE